MAKVTNEEQKVVDFEKAISMTGYGAFHILLLLACGGCLMCVIIETMCMSFIIPAAQCDLELNLSLKGLLSSISFFGVVSSSYMWGYIADTRGRKNVLIISLVISCFTTLICSIIPWAWLFILLRFVNGFAIGGASSVVYAYAGEFHDNHYRPKIISFMSCFVAFGNMYLPGLAWIVLPGEWSIDMPLLDIFFRPWRLLLIIYTLPCLLVATMFCLLPESPKYLLTQGRKDEALDVLRKMHEMNNPKAKEEYTVNEIIWDELGNAPDKKVGMLKSMVNQTLPLFKGELLLKTLMVCYLQFGVFASNSGIAMWYPEILNRMSHFIMDNPNETVSLCEAIETEGPKYSRNLNITDTMFKTCNDTVRTDVFLISLIIGAAYASMYIFIGSVINIFGKKKLMVTFVTITTISGICSQYVYGYNFIQLLVGIFLMGGAGIGLTNAIAVDLFPTQVRAMALAVALMFGRIGAMAGTNVIGPLIYNFCDYLFYVVAADHLILIIVVILLPSTTKLPKLIT